MPPAAPSPFGTIGLREAKRYFLFIRNTAEFGVRPCICGNRDNNPPRLSTFHVPSLDSPGLSRACYCGVDFLTMDPPAPFHPSATRRPRQHVRVGVGVLVVHPPSRRIYAGIRRNSHGAGHLALPGGHLELYESWEECARREVHEEMGIETLEDVQFAHVTNDIMRDDEKHYVTIFMMARSTEEPQNTEADKCEGWKAYTWEELQRCELLFGPLQQLLRDQPSSVLEYLQVER